MRAPSDDELDELAHGVSSLDVRARGRLEAVRVACPHDVDPEAFEQALARRLAATPLGGVVILVQRDDGPARVLGGVFAGGHQR